jgi:NADH:ubiquinone oxidoreductase subunit 2 (subunit N)
MGQHLTILAINAGLVAVLYAGVYPRLSPLTLRRMVRADALATAAALAAAALLFAGRGLEFGIGPVPLRWWSFSILSFALIEAPVFWAFCRARGVSFTDPDAPAPDD